MIKKLFNKLFSRKRIERIAEEKLDCIKIDRKKYLVPNECVFYNDMELEVAKYPEFIDLNLEESLKQMKCEKGDVIGLMELDNRLFSLMNCNSGQQIRINLNIDYNDSAERSVLIKFIIKTIGATNGILIAYDSYNYKQIKETVEKYEVEEYKAAS